MNLFIIFNHIIVYQECVTIYFLKDIISGKIDGISASDSASIVLYARYLKRIGAHLKNITSTIVNPYDKIGYNQ